MTGAGILAPNFRLVMTGGSGSVGGTSIVKGLLMSGGSSGTFGGAVMLTGTASLSMSGGSGVNISGPPPTSVHGLRFSGEFHPVPETYLEPSN
jgi:hypothetical protein